MGPHLQGGMIRTFDESKQNCEVGILKHTNGLNVLIVGANPSALWECFRWH